MKIRRSLASATVALALLLVAEAALAGSPIPVKVGRPDDFYGSGNATYFAWTRDVGPTFETFYQLHGQPASRIVQGGHAIAGQMDPLGTIVPYSHENLSFSKSDIRLFDMAVQAHVQVPSGINTKRPEFWPAISGNQMTFVRTHQQTATIHVVDLTAGPPFVVKTVYGDLRQFLSGPPRINANWITYGICKRTGCDVYRYDSGTQRVPNPLGRVYAHPSPDLAGNVYFVRSLGRCGRGVRLMKWTGVGDPTIVHAFPHGTDVTGTSTFDDGTGGVTVYVDVYDCATRKGDIYSFANP